MELADTSVVVTGGGNGIGLALAQRLTAERPAGIVIADLNGPWAESAAEKVRGLGVSAVGVRCDVADPHQIAALVDTARRAHGEVDVFCSNAGLTDAPTAKLEQSIEQFRHVVDVNMLAHVWAAQQVVPGMLARGRGYLMQTVSSAGLITGPSAPGYTMSKHGALGFAEWLSLNYGHQGLRVSCLCPNAVYTGMFGRGPDDDVDLPDIGALGEILTPENVADTVVSAMTTSEPFLILPHPRVRESFRRKAENYEGWLDRTRGRLQRMAAEQAAK